MCGTLTSLIASCPGLRKNPRQIAFHPYVLQRSNKESSHLLNLCMKLQTLKTILFQLNVLHIVWGIFILLTEQG